MSTTPRSLERELGKAVKLDAERILADILEATEADGRPDIEVKRGGSMAAYYPDEHVIRFRINSWRKLSLAEQRILVIHEWLHSTGQDHDAAVGYSSCHDLFSVSIYLKIWGSDAPFLEMTNRFDQAADALVKRSI